MTETKVEYKTMTPNIDEYVTLEEARENPKIHYTAAWIRILCQQGKVEARKIVSGNRGVWLVHLPSLIDYVEKAEDRQDRRFAPWGKF